MSDMSSLARLFKIGMYEIVLHDRSVPGFEFLLKGFSVTVRAIVRAFPGGREVQGEYGITWTAIISST